MKRIPLSAAPLAASFALLAAAPAAHAQWSSGVGCPLDLEDDASGDDCVSAAPLELGPGQQREDYLAVQGPAGTFPTPSDDDYWLFPGVADGHTLTIDVQFLHQFGNIDAELIDGPGCATIVASGTSTTDDESLIVTNSSGAPVDYVLRVFTDDPAFACNDYTLRWETTLEPCTSHGPDASEPNDGCATASPLPLVGLVADVKVSASDVDYYSYQVLAGELLMVDVVTEDGPGALEVAVFDDGACVTPWATPLVTDESGAVHYANITGAPVDVRVRVSATSAPSDCVRYDLYVSRRQEGCLNFWNDGWEENDDCASANVLPLGLTNSLNVFGAATIPDDDYWIVPNVPDGYEVLIRCGYIFGGLAPTFRLYEGSGCGTLLDGAVTDGGTSLRIARTANHSGAPRDYVLRVSGSGPNFDCNRYSLDLTVQPDIEVGSTFCFGDGTADAGGGPVDCPCSNASSPGSGEGCENSLGHGATLTAFGTSRVLRDDLFFRVDGARPNQPGVLLQGATTIAVPFKDGILCVGPPTERLEIFFLDAAGTALSQSSIVTGGNVSSGMTRSYQYWYRDPGTPWTCTARSNFTQAVEVSWTL